jgi:amidase
MQYTFFVWDIKYIFQYVFYLFSPVVQLNDGVSDLRIGILKEGFNHRNSEKDVDDMVREAAQQLSLQTGVPIEEVSVPMHKDGTIYFRFFIHS